MPSPVPVTPSQTVGPFFHDALPYPEGPVLVPPDRADAVRLAGHVYDGAGDPVPDALLEIWQADSAGQLVREPGLYAAPRDGWFRGFGRCATGDDGGYRFVTVKPGPVALADGTPQAPHIAMAVFARGMLRQVYTRVYFEDEAAANATDPLLATVDADRRDTLLARRDADGYRFDVHLQGDQETVFLDVFER